MNEDAVIVARLRDHIKTYRTALGAKGLGDNFRAELEVHVALLEAILDPDTVVRRAS